MTGAGSRLGLRDRLRLLRRRLVLLRPARVEFQVDGRPFTIYGTWSANRGLGHDFARNGCHEPVLSRLLIGELENAGPDPVYWDVGSALGYFVAIAGRIAAPENVHAFEPGPSYAWLAANNRRLFDGRARTVKAYCATRTDAGAATIALDDYARDHGDPALVKIDVDGAETDVLAGALGTLRRALPVLCLEVHFRGGSGYPGYESLRARLIELLRALPYRYELCRNHRRVDGAIEPLTSLDALPERKDASFDDNDFLLIARRHRSG